MASIHQPFLGSPNTPKASPCKLIFYTLSILSIISLTSYTTLQLTSQTIITTHLSHPSIICSTSPNPNSCLSIISSLTSPSSDSELLLSLLRTSISIVDHAAAATEDVRRRVNDPRQQSALSDCLELMDLSRDRLAGTASAVRARAHADARTWLSAVLTNHVTCLDGLDGPARSAMEARLGSLESLASASLAVLAAASPPTHDDARAGALFPSWVTARDRALMDAVEAVTADAVVAADGSGKYKTVQAAVDASPEKGTARYVIYIKKGTYKENVQIGKTKKNLMLVGDGMSATIITGSLNVVDGSTTFNSATVAAVGDGLILQDLGIKNTAGAVKHQAVALRVGADQSVINRCKIDGYQDTLYTHSLRQFYRDSTISGTVDYIFGNAAVVLQNCKIVSNKPLSNQKNTITAQGRTDPNQNTGTSIQKCQIVASPDLEPVKSSIPTFLGRPWKLYSRTMIMQSAMGDLIDKAGWLAWDGTFALDTLDYEEYANTGAGAGTGGRVKWKGYKVVTSASVAQKFTVAQLIQGGSWLKSTGVTYTEGL
ncbi:Pectinesterase 2.1 [Acorus calamus]|uniref:Pectinesterase n=1 Tax=Acorus calamus TaxID=4465 RepID=A0AAV9C307_ACOCL|nr:Pectinesterase 2.1 [Acorus calamus]